MWKSHANRTIRLALLLAMLMSAPGFLATQPATGGVAQAQGTDRQISRSQYADRLRAMWLGETLANWTGLTTEAVKQDAPFYTDEDWGLDQHLSWKPNAVIDFVFQDPWLADDDTDIEYVYLHLMHQHHTTLLSAAQIADGWRRHINDFIWVSNQQARTWMEQGVLPPATGMGLANPDYLQIDAQLTTEIFGAMAPGMPDQALRLADLPIRTTAGGYAAHAAQFFVLLYSLAPLADQTQSGRSQVVWLVKEARQFIPDTSKTADIVDFVLADFLDNPDVDDWERTRDRVYARYHRDAGENGFVYRTWTESSVNFAAGLIALLYGEGDFRRTVQIGTLTGWDSDNGTATMGGLVGLLIGTDALAAQFPGVSLSDRYYIARTRDDLPDYLPDDPRAEDTFTLMAERMLPLIERTIVAAGGTADGDVWTLPPAPEGEPLRLNPLEQLYRRSANNAVRLAGGTVEPGAAGEVAVSRTMMFADGLEQNFSGQEPRRPPRAYRARAQDGVVTLWVTYDRPVEVQIIRFIEGNAGGFSTITADLLVDGEWQPVPEHTALSQDPDPAIPFQVFDFALPEPIQATGIRVSGRAGVGLPGDVIAAELDALSALPSE